LPHRRQSTHRLQDPKKGKQKLGGPTQSLALLVLDVGSDVQPAAITATPAATNNVLTQPALANAYLLISCSLPIERSRTGANIIAKATIPSPSKKL
jgi:hypothetical protein